MKMHSIAAAVLASFALSACTIESVVDDLNQQAVDAAFDTMKQEAEAQGGAAAKVKRGSEVTIEVTNPESLIHGATVKVPADALPADVDLASISIFYAPIVDPAAGEVALHGNGAKVTLVTLPSGEEVLPIAALTISLPVTKDSTKPIEQIVLGALNTQDGKLVAVENARSDAAKKHAVGDTKGLSMPFAPGWKVEYDGGPADEGEFIFKVTRNGETACIGVGRINPATVTAGITESGGWYKFDLNLVAQGASLTVSRVEATSYGEPANGASITNADTFQFQCGSEVFMYNSTNTTWSLHASEFAEASQSPAATVGTNHVGQARIWGEFDFVALSGEQVQMAFDTVKSDFNWYTNP